MRSNRGNDRSDVIHDFRKIHGRWRDPDSERPGILRLGGFFRRRQQRLGRDTAIIETITAHFGGFDKDCFGAHLAGPGRDGQAARSRTDHTDIRFDLSSHGDLSSYCRGLRNFLRTTGSSAIAPRAASATRISAVTSEEI